MRLTIITLLISWLAAACADRPGHEQEVEDTTASEVLPASHHIDHIILAVKDLETGMDEFEQRTGVRPVFGGVHPGRGTHNALVSLGSGSYIEILAPRPDLDDSEVEQVQSLYGLDRLTPTGWAIRTSDSLKSKEYLRELGYPPSAMFKGSRKTPQGNTLAWTTFGVEEYIPGLPFFIQWSPNTLHPSESSPVGVSLGEMIIHTPKEDRLAPLLDSLEISVQVISAENPSATVILMADGREVVFPEEEE